MAHATELRAKLEEADADGSECIVCGDIVLLRAFGFRIYVDGKPSVMTNERLCQSCGTVLLDRRG